MMDQEITTFEDSNTTTTSNAVSGTSGTGATQTESQTNRKEDNITSSNDSCEQQETLSDNADCEAQKTLTTDNDSSQQPVSEASKCSNDESQDLLQQDTENEVTNDKGNENINNASDLELIKVEEISKEKQFELPVLTHVPSISEENKADAARGATGIGVSSSPDNGQNTYYIKWINFTNKQVPIITQNENGPCPLLAIINVLFLKGQIKLAPMVEMITSEQLMTYLGDYIIENKPKNLSETIEANYEQNMQDGITIMCKLQTGLDVNVQFKGVDDFEYTPECIIFDLLEIPLYHGWLVDPQDHDCVNAIGKLSYNQVVEKIISQKSSENEKEAHEALVAEQFLHMSASQLTYHGLCELSNTVKDNELCVFFRNNHFSTLFKHNKELFLLVTDQGFLTETNVVWETLSCVEGDCHFVDSNFRTYTKPTASTHPIPPPNVAIGSEEQIDHDYLVALSLQQDQPMPDADEGTWDSYQKDSAAIAQHDHELAKRLQEEEDRRAASGEASQRAAPPQSQSTSTTPSIPRRRDHRERERDRQKDKDSCVIL